MHMQTTNDWRAAARGARRCKPEAAPGPGAEENRVVILEEALIEYIGRFGLTDKARAVFDLAPNDLTGGTLRRR